MACVCWATGAFLMELTLCLQTGVDLIAKLKYLNGILKSESAALVSPRGGRGGRGGWWYPRDALVQRWVLEDRRALSNSDVTLYLKEIFKGYQMFGDVFKFQVFLLYTVTLMWALMTIEIIIIGIDRLPVYYLASISAGMVVNFCFVCAIGLLGGTFAKEVKNTKYTSTKILMLYSEGPTRKKVKTLIRMIEHNTPVFSIYGIWTADYGIIVRLFSMFCGSNRLDYKGNIAVPATKGQTIYTVLVCFCTFLSHLAYVINWYQMYYGNNNLLFATGVVCMLFQFITYSFTIARIRLVKQKDNLNLFSLFYRIDRSLALDSDHNINKFQYNLNFVLVLAVTILLIGGCLVNVYACIPKYPVFTVLITIAMLTNYLEIVCIGNYVYYLAIRVRILNFKIQSRVKAMKKVSTHPPKGLLAGTGFKVFNETCIEHHEIRNFTVCLRNILVAYSTISKIFGVQLFTIISSFFVMSFVIFELILEGFRHNFQTYPSAGVITASIVVWFFFMQIWVLALFCNLLISQFRILKNYSVRMQRKIVRGKFYF
ncbi:hypothetical protein JYU34_009540 [Plutella xylostella]|uniref:Gustatory receptor n=1 Tax=Plutella xylostella TaxID=51655 RepID=A0ABQ7QJS8_PLUXY|nr:hypothetical protein JYU34_009540 [Plutella xylostella]